MSDTVSAIVSSARPHREGATLHVGLAADAPSTPPARIGLARLDRVHIGRAETRCIATDTADSTLVHVGLADLRLSQRHARLVRSGTSWILEDLDSKNGSWIRGRRVTRALLDDGDVVIVGHTALIYRSTGGESAGPVSNVSPGLRTMSAALEERITELTAAARTLVPIEITGESGTGKELVARAVHGLSRRAGDFVAINCGAVPASLFEAELFGHRKGAYTGASEERAGLIRSADRGTLFFDEVAELPMTSQAALLRVLQEGEVVPVGSDRPVKVDIRIVTATHQDVDAAVAAGRFRADLRSRLLGFHLELPALRDRPEDLSLVVSELLGRIAGARALRFSIDAVAALYAYEWPLNVRELERVLAAAAALARERIEASHLPARIRGNLGEEGVVDESALSAPDLELRSRLISAIARHKGNLADVARELGKDRTQIRRWMKRLGVRRET